MSLVIKCGYDIFRKQALNVVLKRSPIWSNGIIFGPKHLVLSQLESNRDNHLEFVKYKDEEGHALLLNNTIIFEHKKLFNYRINLRCQFKPDLTDKNLKTFIDFNYVSYPGLRAINTRRGWD
jgi:hypothetical protein